MHKLIEVSDHLIEAGNSVLIIEHHPDIIKVADWLIDLGPEGGERGGEIVAVGTPEQIAANKQSYTGQFLKKHLSASKRPQERLPQQPRAGRMDSDGVGRRADYLQS